MLDFDDLTISGTNQSSSVVTITETITNRIGIFFHQVLTYDRFGIHCY